MLTELQSLYRLLPHTKRLLLEVIADLNVSVTNTFSFFFCVTVLHFVSCLFLNLSSVTFLAADYVKMSWKTIGNEEATKMLQTDLSTACFLEASRATYTERYTRQETRRQDDSV